MSLEVNSRYATTIVGKTMELATSARKSNAIIKTKKFCSPGMATNKPAANPAHVVAVVSKTVWPHLATDFAMPGALTLVLYPVNDVNRIIDTDPKYDRTNHRSENIDVDSPKPHQDGLPEDNDPHAAIVKTAILGDLKSIDITTRSMRIVDRVVSLWASWIPSFMSRETGRPPVSKAFTAPSRPSAEHESGPLQLDSPLRWSSIASLSTLPPSVLCTAG